METFLIIFNQTPTGRGPPRSLPRVLSNRTRSVQKVHSAYTYKTFNFLRFSFYYLWLLDNGSWWA